MIDPSYELIENEAHSSFRCVHNARATFAGEHPLHVHPEYELTWILRSSGTRYVGDSVERYAPGDLVLSGPNLPHCWRDDPGRDGPEWIIAQFNPACFGSGFLALPEAGALRGLLDEARSGLVFAPEAAAAIGADFRGLVEREGLARLVGLIDILERLTHQARTPLADYGYHASNALDRVMVERLERVQRYIAEHLAEEMSQAEIAAELGMRPPVFSKFFRAATGRTFTGLVKLLRINEACRRLATSNARVTDIAFACGYRHASHFDHHFYEIKHMSPTTYRRSVRQLAASERLC